jgi:methylated-DNA-[protein]-cysteine S-methyltransferase
MKRTNEPCVSIEMQSPLGFLTLVASDHGIKAIIFDNETNDRTEDVASCKKDGIDNILLKRAKKQLSEYFDGKRMNFDLPLVPEGTDFQSKVWDALKTIPYGKTVSYGELAAMVGDRKKARAIGAANGRNPIPIIIPCHRVIGRDGSMIGYGGVDKKSFLLTLESSHA